LRRYITVMHDRKNAVVWAVASAVTLWLDFGIRWYTKLAKKASLVGPARICFTFFPNFPCLIHQIQPIMLGMCPIIPTGFPN
jgi:hypothetical protein